MKILKRIVIWIIILAALVFAAGTVYIKYYGKGLLQATLTSALKREVTLGEAVYAFPFGLKANGVTVAQTLEGGKFFEAQEITAQLSPASVVQRKLIFDSVKLTNPSVSVEMNHESGEESQERRYGLNAPVAAQPGSPADGQDSGGEAGPAGGSRAQVVVRHAVLRGGSFAFANHYQGKDFSFQLEDVFVRAENVVFPPAADRTGFHVAGRLVKEGNPLSGSTIEGAGWVNPVDRDMDANVEIVEENGTVGLTAHAVAEHNDMTVNGEMKFQNLLARGGGDKPQDSTLDALIFDALASSGVEIGARYSFQTKMDDFRLEKVSFSGNVLTK